MDAGTNGLYAGVDVGTSALTFGLAATRHATSIDISPIGEPEGGREATLTGLVPYVRLAPTRGVMLWGAVGRGWGDGTFASGPAASKGTELRSRMAAAGASADLLRAGALVFGLRTDGYVIGTRADSAEGLPAVEATSRLGRVAFTTRAEVGSSATKLVPNAAVAVRHDAGDAGAGSGLEVGGGLTLFATRIGLELSASGRKLLVHEDPDLDEWGAAVALRIRTPSRRGTGLSLSVEPSWGTAASRMDAVWNGGYPTGGRGAGEDRIRAAPDRLNVDVAYGVEAFRGGILGLLGQSGFEGGAHRTRVGTRLGLPGTDPSNGGGFRFELMGERLVGAPGGAVAASGPDGRGAGGAAHPGTARYMLGANFGHDAGTHLSGRRSAVEWLSPFGEFRIENLGARRVRVGVNVAAHFLKLRSDDSHWGTLAVQLYGEHVSRPGAPPDYRVGVAAGLPKVRSTGR